MKGVSGLWEPKQRQQGELSTWRRGYESVGSRPFRLLRVRVVWPLCAVLALVATPSYGLARKPRSRMLVGERNLQVLPLGHYRGVAEVQLYGVQLARKDSEMVPERG